MPTDAKPNEIKTRCCVVGGGPAGMMSAYLLARAGIEVVVLEKHADFLRDFRGDTVHPSTLELMHELGLLKDLLKIPHQEVTEMGGQFGEVMIKLADFSHIHSECRFIALMPQWDFLNFLASRAKQYPTFNLKMKTAATGIIEENGRVAGVIARDEDTGEEVRIVADLVISADGRKSVIREAAGMQVQDMSAPMDVLWFRLSRRATDPSQTLGRINAGIMMIMLNREDYWQCGFMIPKGMYEDMREDGLYKFGKKITALAPFLENRLDEITSWDDVKLLTVKVDLLKEWCREGLLCIGDSAHAMSPVGGVGINLAVQDAVATANLLWKPLSEGRCTLAELRMVQQRRLYPTRMTQRMQVFIQNNVIAPTLASRVLRPVPWFMKAFNYLPPLRTIPAHLLGIGVRPEHIQSPERVKPSVSSAL